MSKQAILLACEAVGGQTALARLLGFRSQGAIANWIAAGRVPAERVLSVERVSGVSRCALRPDLYPPEDESPARRNGTTTTSEAG
jgi:DNA-binding transcriptional regulator YdaS (Cro superfamily)